MEEHSIKILLLGDEKVGKTTFLSCVNIHTMAEIDGT